MGLPPFRNLFFGNYFIGILAVALNVETNVQLRLPFFSVSYYCLLFILPVVYYTYAYQHQTIAPSTTNPRSKWYYENSSLVFNMQIVLLGLAALCAGVILIQHYENIIHLPSFYWILILLIIIAGLLYYGLLPGFTLRQVGWLKAFVIGFVWACCANLLPIIMLRVEFNVDFHQHILWVFLFLKNWTFCTVNAIIFDIKDYPSDANKQLKTFVVRYGLRKTIFSILIPILSIGMIALLCFATFKGFGFLPGIINCIPFVLTLYVAYSMRKRHSLDYYLIIIDGLILFKACCGIVAMYFVKG